MLRSERRTGSLRTLAALALCGFSLSACTDTSTIAGTTPSATSAFTAIANGVQPDAMLLTTQQAVGYKRTPAQRVSSHDLATDDQDASVAAQLGIQGYQQGARVEYAFDTKHPVAPFQSVQSQVLFFDDQRGAAAFFAAELQRKSSANGSTTNRVQQVPAGDTDQITVLSQVSQADAVNSTPAANGWYGIMRRGDVIATVFAAGDPATATQVEFLSLVVSQESDLQKFPRSA